MSIPNTRPHDSRCDAHDRAECCGRDICDDCPDLPERCATHDQENAA